MKNNLIVNAALDFLKGMILGFVCVATPGVSGGTIAVMLGLFTRIINAGNDLFHGWFKKTWWITVGFLFVLLLGAVAGAYIGSLAVTFTYDKYPLGVTMLLMGLIIGSIPMLVKNIEINEAKKASNIVLICIIATATLVYTFAIKSGSSVDFSNMNIVQYIVLAIMGVITTATMIIPGISGNIFLAAFGYWAPLNAVLSSITTTPLEENLPILATFAVGCVIGAVGMIKLIKILLNKFATKTNIAIATFVICSPIVMVKVCLLDNANFVFNYKELLVGSLLLVLGFAISYSLGIFASKKKEITE